MKTIILYVILLVSLSSIAQVTPFIKGSLDPKMLAEGPHPDNENYADSSYDYEIQLGVEFDNFRFSMAYQSHKEILFQKFTYIMLDYGLKDFPFNKIHCYAGIEMSSIFRDFPDAQPSDTYWRTHEASTYMLGVNAEIQYMPFEHFGITSTLNAYAAEPALKRYGKDYRWEVMVGLIYKIYSVNN